MKRIHRFLSILLTLCLIVSMIPMHASAAQSRMPGYRAREMTVGDEEKLRISPLYGQTVWSSSDESVATVSSNGTVKAISAGTADITAVSSLFRGSRIKPKTTVFSITVVAPEAVRLSVSEALQLSVDARGRRVKWTSADPQIATVSKDGTVTGVSPGITMVTASIQRSRFPMLIKLPGLKTTIEKRFEVTVLSDESGYAYLVSFHTDGGSEIPAQAVKPGCLAHAPEDPVKADHHFAGWYLDAACRNRYAFSEPVTRDLTLYARWNRADGSQPRLTDFDSDIFDIYLNTETLVTFTVKLENSSAVSGTAISVYDDRNSAVAAMNDEGRNGDQTAGDMVYTGQAVLSSPEIRLSDYYAAMGDTVSNAIELCYYRDLSKEELLAFATLHDNLNLKTFDEACTFFRTSDEIVSYTIDPVEQTVLYDTVYGICGIYGLKFDPSVKGNGEFAIPSEQKDDWSAMATQFDSLNFTPATSKHKVTVLRPFRHSEFKYDEFSAAGQMLAKALGGNADIIDDENVTLDVMKSLSDSGAVLVDSHGGVTAFNTPYILIGEQLNQTRFDWDPIYYAKHIKYTADYVSHRIYCTGHMDRLAVSGKFFKKYYSNGSLNDSIWYLGCCYGMKNDSISSALLKRGAEAVVGFSNAVYVSYCNQVLYEVLLNSMMLSADTAGNAVQCARNIYGVRDPQNPDCYLKSAGNMQFKLIDSVTQVTGTVSGKICKASDRTTPVADAVISIYRGGRLYRTLPCDAQGNYTATLPVGDYMIKITADGYLSFTSFATVTENENIYLETFLMIEGDPTLMKTATGQIKNAMTGVGIEGVSLTIREGWNHTTGDVFLNSDTDSSGNYSVLLPIGNYTIYAEKEGYVPGVINIIVQPNMTEAQDGALAPKISEDTYMIVLTWGTSPRDLDSHVQGVRSDGSSFHVYFGDKSAYDGQIEICNLDVDDTSGEGPETIRLHTTVAEPYYYYIYNYSRSGTMGASGAQIRVYRGSELIRTFNVPTNLPDGLYWNVFALRNGNLIVRNTLTSSAELQYAASNSTTPQSIEIAKQDAAVENWAVKDPSEPNEAA